MTRNSRSAVILRNISSNWVGYIVSAAVTLLLTPFVLQELGEARYGIWILTSSIVGYYGFFDLGFRAGVTQYLTRYLAMGDFEKASESISTAVTALFLLGTVVVALSIGGAYVAPYLFAIPAEVIPEAFWCILIVGISSAAQIVFSPYGSVFTAVQRFDLSNLIGVGTRLLTAGGIVVVLKNDCGLIGVSAAFCGANVTDYLIRWRVASYLVPDLNVSWTYANLSRFREIASFGGWNFLISINRYVYGYVPPMIIAAFMPVAAVGYYALATGLLRNVNSVLSPIGQVIYPVAVELHVKGRQKELVRLYHDGSRVMMLAMISLVLATVFWSEDFYRLWIGQKYISGERFHSVALLFQILLITTFASYVSNIAAQILVGVGRVRIVSTALICGSLVNLTLSLILVRPYGLVGIAAATVIASVLIDMIAIPLLLQNIIGLSVKDFLHKACIRPVVAGALQTILIVAIQFMEEPEDWYHLIQQGLLTGVGLAVIVLIVGLTRAERERFVIRPMQRLFV